MDHPQNHPRIRGRKNLSRILVSLLLSSAVVLVVALTGAGSGWSLVNAHAAGTEPLMGTSRSDGASTTESIAATQFQQALEAVRQSSPPMGDSSLSLRGAATNSGSLPANLVAASTLLNLQSWTDPMDNNGELDMSGAAMGVDSDTGQILMTISFYPPFYGDDVGQGGDGVAVLIDADSNINTGDYFPGALGADYEIAFAYSLQGWSATLWRTPSSDSSTWSVVRYLTAVAVDLTNGGTALGVYVSPGDIGNPAQMSFFIGTVYNVNGQTIVDKLPDPPYVATYLVTQPSPTTTLPPTTTTTRPTTTTTTIPGAPHFSDVPSTDPYYVQISDLATRKIVNGFANGTFQPNAWVTRQQFAKMIVKTLQLPVSLQNVCPFLDVASNMDPTDPLYPDHYVAVCAAHGITTGKTPTSFAPYASLTRAQLITMVVRAANLPDPPADYTPPFGAFDTTHYPNARKAAYAGLLNGVQGMGPSFDFFAPATRGEVCVLLYNLLHR